MYNNYRQLWRNIQLLTGEISFGWTRKDVCFMLDFKTTLCHNVTSTKQENWEIKTDNPQSSWNLNITGHDINPSHCPKLEQERPNGSPQ